MARLTRHLAWCVLAGATVCGPAWSQATPNMRAVPTQDPATWFSPDDYPSAARRSDRQGRVVVAVAVDIAGRVTGCTVEQSSGTTLLDERTCQLAITKGRFQPGTDATGAPTASSYTLPVRWAMPVAPLEVADVSKGPPADEMGQTETIFAADGTMLTCRVVALQTRKTDVDLCKGARIGVDSRHRWLRNGKPVGVRVLYTVKEQVELLP